MPYSVNDLVTSYQACGVKAGQVVYLTGNFGRLGVSLDVSKVELFERHLQALWQILGEQGTIVVPTHSASICNTDQIFDLALTKSEMGPFSEYVRLLEGSVRSFHPFFSRTAIGAKAEYICGHNSRHSYGGHTPFSRMLELDALFISVGIEPRQIVSLVHQCELEMGVPYRYNKEFMHQVIRDGRVTVEPFYHLVTYLDCDIVRDKNIKIFEHFKQQHKLHQVSMGKGTCWAFNMKSFYQSTTELMSQDIYSWLQTPPTKRPYQN
ncbi:AAC(3) family N-acetyltransferase [Psychrosphaera sp. B3R10]|nr:MULTISPECIES: AAC(3) family N-acetyltransferase [unclassified Psychrosphaera]MBU2884058.1 AAC(3) family N-acetyltransferase [Psychrosphaera sp. I2R16]MBU2988188.1 AAC(3) family N-acetyltransferase [Psychrosphaera sp. B3R10]